MSKTKLFHKWLLFLVGSSMARLSDTFISSYEKKSSILYCFVQNCKLQNITPMLKEDFLHHRIWQSNFFQRVFKRTLCGYSCNSSVLTPLCMKIPRSNTAESPWSSSHHFCMIDIKIICSKDRSSGRKL